MSVLFDLPDELCNVLCTEWMSTPELGFMDSAVCSHLYRKQLLTFLRNVVESFSSGRGLSFLHWINARKIRVSQLSLDPIMKSSSYIAALTFQWKYIQFLSMKECSHEDMDCLNSCINLTSLTCEDCELNLAAVNGPVISRLTHISIASDNSVPLPTLIGIREHCRHLKSLDFSYFFAPTAETTPVMIDILRLNHHLKDVDIEITPALLQTLVTHCSHSMERICVTGGVDFHTINNILLKFDRIERITIGSGFESELDFHVLYDKIQHRLELSWQFDELPGWDDFLSQLPSLSAISWDKRCSFDLSMERLLTTHFQTLRCVEIDCVSTTSTILESLLDRCTALKTFKCRCHSDQLVNWSNVLRGRNFEELTIGGPNEHITKILKICPSLSFLSYEDIVIPFQNVSFLLDAVRDYRHIVTGKPIKIRCRLRPYDCSFSKILSYDGFEFSGRYWEEYMNLVNDEESETDEVILLEDKVERLKQLLSQIDEN